MNPNPPTEKQGNKWIQRQVATSGLVIWRFLFTVSWGEVLALLKLHCLRPWPCYFCSGVSSHSWHYPEWELQNLDVGPDPEGDSCSLERTLKQAFRETKWFIMHSCSQSQAAALKAVLSLPAQYQSARVIQRDCSQHSKIFHHGIIKAVSQCQGAFSFNPHNLMIRLNPGMKESC